MTQNEFRFFENIEDLKKEYLKLKQDWKEIKKSEHIKFPEFTDEKFDELKLLASKKPANKMDEVVNTHKGSNIVNELVNMHFKGAVDLSFILSESPTSDKIQYFIKYNNHLTDKDYWSNLSFCYQNQDYRPVPYEILNSLFRSNRSGIENLMNKTERQYFENLPEKFPIYRAMSKKEFDTGKFRFSWTLSQEIAEKFKNRNESLYSEEIIVHKVNVDKENVTAYLNGRNEEEIIYLR